MATLNDGGKTTFHLPAGHQLTVNAPQGAARFRRIDEGFYTNVAAGGSETVGPYATSVNFLIEALDGQITYVATPHAPPTLTEARAFGTDLIEYSGGGAPAASVQASKAVNPTGDENALTFTAVTAGAGGNSIAIEYLDPGENSASLSVTERYGVISVSLATDGSGDITSTAAEVKAAVEANAAAAALVTVAIDASDSGGSDDGSGVVTAMARSNLANGAGVGAGAAGIGSRYTDTTNGVLYINNGTKAVPTWTALAEVS